MCTEHIICKRLMASVGCANRWHCRSKTSELHLRGHEYSPNALPSASCLPGSTSTWPGTSPPMACQLAAGPSPRCRQRGPTPCRSRCAVERERRVPRQQSLVAQTPKRVRERQTRIRPSLPIAGSGRGQSLWLGVLGRSRRVLRSRSRLGVAVPENQANCRVLGHRDTVVQPLVAARLPGETASRLCPSAPRHNTSRFAQQSPSWLLPKTDKKVLCPRTPGHGHPNVSRRPARLGARRQSPTCCEGYRQGLRSTTSCRLAAKILHEPERHGHQGDSSARISKHAHILKPMRAVGHALTPCG